MDPTRNEALANGAEPAQAPARYPWLKTYPKNVDWSAPLKGVPLQSLLEKTAAAYGSRVCSNFMGKTLTYAEINGLADKVAAGLQKRGVRKGVNVGLLLPNTPTFIIFYYGILKAGGTVVNFNPLYTVDELSHQARDSRLQMLVTLDLAALFPKAEAVLSNNAVNSLVVAPFAPLLPGLKSVLFKLLKRKDVADWRASPHSSRIIGFDHLIDNDGKPDPVAVDPVSDVAVLQ